MFEPPASGLSDRPPAVSSSPAPNVLPVVLKLKAVDPAGLAAAPPKLNPPAAGWVCPKPVKPVGLAPNRLPVAGWAAAGCVAVLPKLKPPVEAGVAPNSPVEGWLASGAPNPVAG